ncbi:phosphotransferase [Candidatus Poribacteria bacterium]|nr:phosphotransferase [Candidatus Poribacteria bacterium]
MPNKTGETFSASGDQVYALSEFVEGQNYEIAEPTDQLRAAGEMLGRLHQQLHGFQSPIEPPWQPIETELAVQLKDRLARLRPAIDDSKIHPVSKHQIDRWLEEVEVLMDNCQLSILNSDPSREWVIHGDYRAQNLKFAGKRIRAILDLDTARPAERLFDLGYALVFFPAVYQDVPLTSEQRAIFLHAYESTCPLSEAERKLLPSHLKLAFLRGITLWLDLYHFAGMRERTDPWIQSYLRCVDEVVGFQCEA